MRAIISASLLLALVALLVVLLPYRSLAQATRAAGGPLQLGGNRRGVRPSLVVVSTLDGGVVGYDAATGAAVFSVRSDAPALDSWAREGHPEYVPTLDGALYRLDATTGEAVAVDSRFISSSPDSTSPVLAKTPAGVSSGAVVLTAQKTSALYVNLRTGTVVRSLSFGGGKDGLTRDVRAAGVRPGDDIVLLSQTSIGVRVLDAASAEEVANATLTHTNPSFLSKGQCLVSGTDSDGHIFSASVSEDRSRIIVRGKEGRVVWEKKIDSAVVEAHGMGSVTVASNVEMDKERPSLPGHEGPRALADGENDGVDLVVAREGKHRYMVRAKPNVNMEDGQEDEKKVSDDGDVMVYKVRQPRRRGDIGVSRPVAGGEQSDGLAIVFSFVVVICLMAGYAIGRRPRRRARRAERILEIEDTANGNLPTTYASFDEIPVEQPLIEANNAAESQRRRQRVRKKTRSPVISADGDEAWEGRNGDADDEDIFISSNESTGSRSSGGVMSNRTVSGWMNVGCLRVSNKVLGVGSHGTVVYEGKMLPGERKVAVKRLLRQFFESARKEISLLVELDEASPYVVRYFAMEEDSEFIYLALELCAGTLAERVTSHECPAPPLEYKRGPAPVATTRSLRQLLQGLAGLHRAGVVHRDLKPQNVLLSRISGSSGAADIKLADVGLALRLAANRSSYTAISNAAGGVGTTGWRAPEVLRGGRQTKAVDIFAAGCIVGFVLSGGKHPFGTAIFGRDGNIAANKPVLKPLEDLDLPEAVDIVKKMIHPESTERPTADAALCHPFFWTDAMKLAFLVDISDRLYDLRNEPARYTENLDRSPLAVHFCNDWIIRMDMELLSGLGRGYEATASGLLRVIRNKKNHYSELTPELQKLLGRLPEDESSDGSAETDEHGLHAHNFLTYFTSRVPQLLMCAYQYALCNPALVEQPHFTRYGFKVVILRESPALHPLVRRLQQDRHGAALDMDESGRPLDEPDVPQRRLYQRFHLVELQKTARRLPEDVETRLRECGMYSADSAARWTERLATGVFEPIESNRSADYEDDSNDSSVTAPAAVAPPGFEHTPRFRPTPGYPSPARPSPTRPSPGRPSSIRPSPGRAGPPGFATSSTSDFSSDPPFSLHGNLAQGNAMPFNPPPGYRSITSVGNRRARMSGQAQPNNNNNNNNNGEQRVIDFSQLRRR